MVEKIEWEKQAGRLGVCLELQRGHVKESRE